MKLKSLLVIITVLALFGFKPEKQNLNGTYKIVSEEIVRNGKSNFTIHDHKNNGLKTWSDQYFLFVNTNSEGAQPQSSFGGGTYELSGNKYTEHIEHHVAPNYRGITLRLHLEIKGDTIIQIFPCDASYYYDKNNCVIQKYVRVD